MTTTNFSEIFKSSFIENMSEFSMIDSLLAMLGAFVIGLIIMQVYQKTFKGVIYSASFSASLMFLTLVTTLTILAVTSNIVLSLGMVGALSIVRFRSAVKEPMDIAFLFWSISEGIVIGAGLFPLAVLGVIFISLIMIFFVNKESRQNPYIFMITCADEVSEKEAIHLISAETKKYLIKSKTLSVGRGIELTIDIQLKDKKMDFINVFNQNDKFSNVVLVSYNGDYMG